MKTLGYIDALRKVWKDAGHAHDNVYSRWGGLGLLGRGGGAGKRDFSLIWKLKSNFLKEAVFSITCITYDFHPASLCSQKRKKNQRFHISDRGNLTRRLCPNPRFPHPATSSRP